MFERIKAYKKLKESDKILKGCIKLSELVNNEELLKNTVIALNLNKKLKKKIWFNREMAVNYLNEIAQL